MNPHPFQVNLVVAWLWVLLGFLSGMVLGLKFHQENWLGGYASHRRRLYRLGHISFFGLGMANLMFALVAPAFPAAKLTVLIASWGFVIGAVTMPVCCCLMARDARWRHLFAIPVVSLIVSATLTLWEVIQL